MSTGRVGRWGLVVLTSALTLAACGGSKGTLGSSVAPRPPSSSSVPSPKPMQEGIITGRIGLPCGGLVEFPFPGGTVAAVKGILTTRYIAPGESVEIVPNGRALRLKVGPDGRFRIKVQPGKYVVHVIGAGRFTPSLWPPISVQVRAASTTQVDIQPACKSTD